MLLLIYGLALGTGWPFEQVGLNANLGALPIAQAGLELAQATLGQETGPNL